MIGARVEPGVLKLLEALAKQRGVRPADVVRSALARELEWRAPALAERLERAGAGERDGHSAA